MRILKNERNLKMNERLNTQTKWEMKEWEKKWNWMKDWTSIQN